MTPSTPETGAIAWMTRNPVAANLLMTFLLLVVIVGMTVTANANAPFHLSNTLGDGMVLSASAPMLASGEGTGVKLL